MNELLGYVFSPLREEGISLYRGSGDGLAPILLVAAEETSPDRREHESPSQRRFAATTSSMRTVCDSR